MSSSSWTRRVIASLVLLAGALVPPASAQQATGTVTGTVTDRTSGRPIPDVNVVIIGTTRGARTGETGQYRITGVPAGTHQLRASRLGYTAAASQVTVAAGGEQVVNFQMGTAAVQIDAVTVTATGETQRKREVGATIATIDSSALNLANVSNLSQVLTSRAAGVTVQSATGTTGGSSRIRIRGSNSISLSNDPLLVIDGVRVNNSTASSAIGVGGQTTSRFNDINPEEIESIEVIKGPAAAALYGTAAANGVIQVTTRKGRAGKTRWEAFYEGGTLKDVNKYPSNYRQFGTRLDAAGQPTTGLTSDCTIDDVARMICRPDSLVVNNPIAKTQPLQPGERQNFGLSATGGTQSTTYFLAGEIEREQGVYDVNHLRRLNIRSNLRSQLTPTLDATLNIGWMNSDLRRPQNDNNLFGAIGGGLLGYAWDCGPARSYPAFCGSDTTSRGYAAGLPPQTFYAINTRENMNRITGSLTSNWQALSWLAFNGILGADVGRRDENETVPPNAIQYNPTILEGSRFVGNADIRTYTSAATATANFDLTPTLRSTSAVGAQYNQEDFTRVDAFGAKLLAGTNSLNGTAARFSVGETNTRNRTLGFIGRQQIAWRDRLFLTAAARTDRNSAFGQQFGWIVYPALNASWVVSEEEFFPQVAALSSLRLRGGFGSSGQRPSFRDAIQFYEPVVATVAGADVPAFSIGNIGNPNLKPEFSQEVEAGFDLGLFENRVTVEYSFYNKETRDALVSVPLAPSIGSSASQFRNLGKVRNWGNEVSFRSNLFEVRGAALDLNANFSANRNKLIDLGSDASGKPLPEIYLGFGSTQRFQEGFPLGGYFQQTYTYADKNGDNIISRVNCPGQPVVAGGPECEITLGDTASAARFLGSPFPTREINVSPVLRVGEWLQLQALLDHRGGQKLMNYTRAFRCTSAFRNCQEVYDPANATLEQQAAFIAFRTGFTNAGYIEDASFTKLREVSATFRIPQRFAQRINAGGASLTLAGRNLKTWTDYTGLDPEVNANATASFSTSDFLTQPQVRYFTARLTLSF